MIATATFWGSSWYEKHAEGRLLVSPRLDILFIIPLSLPVTLFQVLPPFIYLKTLILYGAFRLWRHM